ncbi:hypothetical protein ACFPN7_05510 [Amycolatopsis halotolerans]|uniref:hypothetical protein n=1 Tax=Amycolatopsis halotolerans TaxID=330083 RepID=UPI003612A0A4
MTTRRTSFPASLDGSLKDVGNRLLPETAPTVAGPVNQSSGWYAHGRHLHGPTYCLTW